MTGSECRPSHGPSFASIPQAILDLLLDHMDNQGRARFELVCRPWLQASRAAQPARVEFTSRGELAAEMGELLWLAERRVSVRRASLHFADSSYSSQLLLTGTLGLGRWAGTLQALYIGAATVPSISFLAGLRHLTTLGIAIVLPAPGCELSALSSLQRLRSLRWVVDYELLEEGAVLQLPRVPDCLWHLSVFNSGYQPLTLEAGQLSALHQLETLSLGENTLTPGSFADFTSLASLTYICLTRCELASLPAQLSSLTALRCLIACGNGLGESAEGVASLGLLGSLPNLEYLDLEGCDLPGPCPLPWQPPARLRVLCISGNPCVVTGRWLSQLCKLKCSWHQVPAGDVAKGALLLEEVDLRADSYDAAVGKDQAVRTLESLRVLPCLRALYFTSQSLPWVDDTVAAFAALCLAKPGLKVDCRTRLGPSWFPDIGRQFCS